MRIISLAIITNKNLIVNMISVNIFNIAKNQEYYQYIKY